MARQVRVALLARSERLGVGPFPGDMKLLREAMEAEPCVQFAEVAWDDPGVDWSSFTHLLCTGELDYAPYLDQYLRWLSALESLGLATRLHNPPNVARWNSKKTYLRELEAAGVRTPPTAWLESGGDSTDIIAALRTFTSKDSHGNHSVTPIEEVVFKNVVDAGGVTAWKCRFQPRKSPDAAPTLLPEHLERLQAQLASTPDGVMVQPFLKSIVSEGEWSLMYFDGELSHVMLKKPAPTEFRVQEFYGGAFELVPQHRLPEGLIDFSNVVLQHMPFTETPLFARVDVVVHRGEPLLMELELVDPFMYLTEPEEAVRLLAAICKRA